MVLVFIHWLVKYSYRLIELKLRRYHTRNLMTMVGYNANLLKHASL